MTVERQFDAKSMPGMLRRYEATVGDLFAVVPPLMSRYSVKTADIDGVTLRRISVKDLMEGIPMPEDKVEGVELIRVDAAKADRYRLRAGDILMLRMPHGSAIGRLRYRRLTLLSTSTTCCAPTPLILSALGSTGSDS